MAFEQEPAAGDERPPEGPIPAPDQQLYFERKEDLEEGVRQALAQLEDEVDGKRLEEMSPEELAEAADHMRQGEIDYLERQSQNEDKEVAERAKFVLSIKEKMDTLIDEVNVDIKKGDKEVATKKIKDFLAAMRKDLETLPISGEDVDAALHQMEFLIELDAALIAADEKTKSALLTLLSLGIDLVPFVGGVKMMGEGALGKTLDGQDLEGMRRLTHMGEGLFWEVVDVVAVAAAIVGGAATAPAGGEGAAAGPAIEAAAMAAKVGHGAEVAGKAVRGAGGVAKAARAEKAVLKAPRVSKTMTRTGAFMRKHGVSGSKEMYCAGRLLIKNPELEKVVQKGFEKGFERRTAATAEKAVKEGPKEFEKLKESRTAQVELLQELNDEREELTRMLDEIARTVENAEAA